MTLRIVHCLCRVPLLARLSLPGAIVRLHAYITIMQADLNLSRSISVTVRCAVQLSRNCGVRAAPCGGA